MFTKQQITEIKKGIKLAVKQLNLEGDKLFAETEKEIKAIEKKIVAVGSKEKSYLETIGFVATLQDNSVMNLNLQEKTIHNFIYNRNEEFIMDLIDINKLIESNN